MLLKIICICVLVACPRVVGYDGGDEASSEYRGEDSDDSFGGYQQDNDEDAYPVRVKRFESKPTVKTLSPREIREVRGAIQQILSGYNQNPFTPLPPEQATNEKRPISDKRAVHKPRSAQTQENYQFDARTKFTEYTESKPQISTTNEPLTADSPVFTSTSAIDGNYDGESDNYIIHGTSNSLSSLPIVTGTDDGLKTDNTAGSADEIVNDNDVTGKATETNDYESQANMGLTGATINVLPIATMHHIARTDTDDVKSQINDILGRANEPGINISFNETAREGNVDNEIGSETTDLPTRSPSPEMHGSEPGEVKLVTASNDANEKTELVAKPDSTDNIDPIKESDSPEKPDSAENLGEHENQNLPTRPDGEQFPHNVEDVVSKEQEEFESEEDEYYPTTTKKKRPGSTTAMSKKPSKPSGPTRFTRKTPTRKTTTKKRTIPTLRTTTTKFKLDVPALLAIIANLTYDYELNLTRNLNQTLLKYSIPTCETPTTTEKRGLFVDYDANATGTIVAKCFVCGLEAETIPRNAHCADAFAGDFLPLVPVDMTARGKISKYRKYCRFADVPHYMTNETQPRSVFGRWTGGCSVRWIDLSGVYTQRSCRNRDRAILGRHFASKRMAKLEMALSNVENGCITSPMATLVPLSRGISLYARFHACVCTGSWCNAADLRIPWTYGTLVPLLIASISPYLII